MLLTCDLRDAPTPSREPLRFVGIDASAFSVAKSLVLAEMLGMLGVKAEREDDLGENGEMRSTLLCSEWHKPLSVRDPAVRPCAGTCTRSFEKFFVAVRRTKIPWELRVWYSATCSKAASKNFARAASQSLAKVKHEQVRPWLESGRSMKRHEDQLKMCHYLLTGDILDQEKPEVHGYNVGNPAMWSLPPSSPPISHGESAFDAVEIDDLANGEAPTSRGNDILDRLVQELLRRLKRLRQWLLEGEVEVDLRCDFVDLEASW
eukprot:Skav207298  [mRNA]  locus=scaffold1463:162875:168326:- [translate_table: standard]